VNAITATQSIDAKRPVLSGRYNRLVGTATLVTQSVTTIAALYTLKFSGTGSIALSGTSSGTITAGTYTITCTAGTLTLTVTGSVTQADLRYSNYGLGLPTYQAVVDANTYDISGFPLRPVFNGATQFLKVETLDMSSTDAVSVFTGVRKLSDAATGIVCELSPSNATNGSFTLFAPSLNGVNSYRFSSRGTEAVQVGSGVFAVAPNSSVLTGAADISADFATLRRNGALVETATTDQGTGNYGSYSLYIGMRAGTSLAFNGELTRLTIIGKLLENPIIDRIERIIANQMRLYLPPRAISDLYGVFPSGSKIVTLGDSTESGYGGTSSNIYGECSSIRNEAFANLIAYTAIKNDPGFYEPSASWGWSVQEPYVAQQSPFNLSHMPLRNQQRTVSAGGSETWAVTQPGSPTNLVTVYYMERTAATAAKFDFTVKKADGTTLSTQTIDTYVEAPVFGSVGAVDVVSRIAAVTLTLSEAIAECHFTIDNIAPHDGAENGTIVFFGFAFGFTFCSFGLFFSLTALR
jgi:hypothetical protein